MNTHLFLHIVAWPVLVFSALFVATFWYSALRPKTALEQFAGVGPSFSFGVTSHLACLVALAYLLSS